MNTFLFLLSFCQYICTRKLLIIGQIVFDFCRNTARGTNHVIATILTRSCTPQHPDDFLTMFAILAEATFFVFCPYRPNVPASNIVTTSIPNSKPSTAKKGGPIQALFSLLLAALCGILIPYCHRISRCTMEATFRIAVSPILFTLIVLSFTIALISTAIKPWHYLEYSSEPLFDIIHATFQTFHEYCTAQHPEFWRPRGNTIVNIVDENTVALLWILSAAQRLRVAQDLWDLGAATTVRFLILCILVSPRM